MTSISLVVTLRQNVSTDIASGCNVVNDSLQNLLGCLRIRFVITT
jgi:hypothetical protein